MTAKTESTHARESRIRKATWLVSFVLASLTLPALAVEESKSEKIGPWEIEATFKGDNFASCSINRKLENDIVASFVRSGDGLTLVLESPNWKLERGKQYPVKVKLGPFSSDAEVAAESNSASLDIKDKKISSGLRTASALDVIGAGATIQVPLDKSREAFDRLEQCVAKNNTAVETNPFVAPARQP